MDNIEIDNSPQAKFVKNLLRKDHPDYSEAQIEQLWNEKLRKLKETEGEDACLACGS
jgi:hypothetical protein